MAGGWWLVAPPRALAPLYEILSIHCLGFLTVWWLASKAKHAKKSKASTVCLFVASLQSHSVTSTIFIGAHDGGTGRSTLSRQQSHELWGTKTDI